MCYLMKITYFEHPHPRHCRDTWWLLGGEALQKLKGYLVIGHCRDTLRLGTAGILGGVALQGYSAVGHCRDTHWLGTAGILRGWALQGHSAAGHCRDIWWFGTAGLCGWALQGYFTDGHCRDTWWLGTAGTLFGWALQSGSVRRARTT